MVKRVSMLMLNFIDCPMSAPNSSNGVKVVNIHKQTILIRFFHLRSWRESKEQTPELTWIQCTTKLAPSEEFVHNLFGGGIEEYELYIFSADVCSAKNFPDRPKNARTNEDGSPIKVNKTCTYRE